MKSFFNDLGLSIDGRYSREKATAAITALAGGGVSANGDEAAGTGATEPDASQYDDWSLSDFEEEIGERKMDLDEVYAGITGRKSEEKKKEAALAALLEEDGKDVFAS